VNYYLQFHKKKSFYAKAWYRRLESVLMAACSKQDFSDDLVQLCDLYNKLDEHHLKLQQDP